MIEDRSRPTSFPFLEGLPPNPELQGTTGMSSPGVGVLCGGSHGGKEVLWVVM